LIKILKDIYFFIKLKFSKSNYRIGFFCENNFIFNYLKPYILKKLKKEKILIISLEKIPKKNIEKASLFVFQTKFFQELVFLTLKLKFLYSSTPDLNKTIFKKSRFSKCKYIYLQHSPVSHTLIYNQDAFNEFDAIQTINNYQLKEIKEINLKEKLKIKPFKSKYLFLINQMKTNKQKPQVDLIVAPSWNSNFYKLNCHILLKDLLSQKEINYKLRPHPMSFKKNEISQNEINDLKIPLDFDTTINFYKYNFLISDWSGIFIEYAWIYKRKAFLINTPKKLLNKNYTNYNNQPIEIILRNILGKTFEVENLDNLVNEISLLKKQLNEENKLNKNENVEDEIKNNFFTNL
tara:strand:+ start:1364 stop:2410 length:1047 start_codon:yes stop_codon:yes gene_type:complete